jgi:AcrR family transcriptional regulator
MRVKTDARRRCIVTAAWEVFKENGFARTTMSEISDRLGGSKATLYGYFKSKEELFFAALEDACQEQSEGAYERLSEPGPLEVRLWGFARAYMELRLSPDLVAVNRMMNAEAERSIMLELLWAKQTAKWQRVAAVLQAEMERGALRRAEPYRTAQHFRALVELDLVERRLQGDQSVTPAVVEEETREGVRAFLRAYAP